jgi:phosphatidylcholine synthase
LGDDRQSRRRAARQQLGQSAALLLRQRAAAMRSSVGQRQLAALAVHVFTASGAALGFFALLAAIRYDFTAMFWWLAIALFVDGIDGAFARRAQVVRFASRYSGDVLDLVVDYLTYVVVPTYALFVSGLLPTLPAAIAAIVIVVTSALYFADTTMKTDDYFFKGFPGVWNIVVFYLLLLKPPEVATFLFIMLCAGLSFAPIVFVHPVRVVRFRVLTLGLLLLGLVLTFVALHYDLDPPAIVKWALVAIGLYFTSLGFFRRPKH